MAKFCDKHDARLLPPFSQEPGVIRKRNNIRVIEQQVLSLAVKFCQDPIKNGVVINDGTRRSETENGSRVYHVRRAR